jgi:hypothetical protein
MPRNRSDARTHCRTQALKAFGLGFAVLASQGMSCSEHRPLPSLSTIHLNDIHLQIVDPASGKPGVFLAWSPPTDGKVTYYEIYQGFRMDSLGHSAHTQPASDPPQAILLLPDSSAPFTVYYAVRSIFVEGTGQKEISDTLDVDSLTVLPSFSILSPSPGSFQPGRTLRMKYETHSDNGIVLKATLFEKYKDAWAIKQDTCLPLETCGVPIFGGSLQSDSLVLEDVAPGDTVSALFCVLGTESFQDQRTGLNQSLGCSRYFRVAE